MSAELADQSFITTIDSRVGEAEMALAEHGQGGLAIRYRNARKMLEAFYNNGTPDEVADALSLTPEEFNTSIDDAQSLHDDLSLHIIPLNETVVVEGLTAVEIQLPEEEILVSDTPEQNVALVIAPEHEPTPIMTKEELVDTFLGIGSHEDSASFRESFERLLSLTKEAGTSLAAEAAKFLRTCLVEVVDHGPLDNNELPRELFTGEVFSSEERQRLFKLIGILAKRNGRGQYIATVVDPIVLKDIRNNARSGNHNPDEAETNVISALNVIAQRLGVSTNP